MVISRNESYSQEMGSFQRYELTETSVKVYSEQGTIELTPYGEKIIKVFTLPTTASVKEERPGLSVSKTPGGEFSIEESDTHISIVTDFMIATLDKSDSHMIFKDGQGHQMLVERQPVSNGDGEKKIKFQPASDIAFYGGGYNSQALNIDNCPQYMDNYAQYGWDNSSYKQGNFGIPVAISTNGYGIYIDDHYKGAVLTPSSSEGTEYRSWSPSPISYYFMISEEKRYGEVAEAFNELTGRQPLPPLWAMGYITSRYGYVNTSEAEGVVEDIRQAGIPIDGIVFDIQWQGPDCSWMGTLKWYTANWEDPAGMISRLQSKRVNSIVISEPYFTSKTDNYYYLKEKGWLADSEVAGMGWLQSDKVGVIDITNEEASDWMWQYYAELADMGIAGWWFDLGELEKDDSDTQFQIGTRDEVHNEYNNIWMERVSSKMEANYPTRRPMIMTRSGAAGMQRFGAFPWTGDIKRSWSGLQLQIPAMINAGMSGVGYLTSDVGGFAPMSDHGEPELYLRWVEMSVFTPNIRTHSGLLPEPTNSCYDDVREDVKRYINLHYQYLPLSYTLAYENSRYGTPLMRSVNYYNVGEASLADCRDEYLWGKSLLVAPMMEDSGSREVILPPGRWLDMNDKSKIYEGMTTISYTAPLATLPYFCGEGAVLPRYRQSQFTNTAEADHSDYSLLVFLTDTGEAEGYLYDDDHTTRGTIEREEYSLLHIEAKEMPGEYRLGIVEEGKGFDGMASERKFEIEMPHIEESISQVTLETSGQVETLTQVEYRESLTATGTWCYDSEANMLRIYTVKGSDDIALHIKYGESGVSGIEGEIESDEMPVYDLLGRPAAQDARTLRKGKVRIAY
ncbi:MAG: TIM-barrel domain-containing protein [Lepagella sp.]